MDTKQRLQLILQLLEMAKEELGKLDTEKLNELFSGMDMQYYITTVTGMLDIPTRDIEELVNYLKETTREDKK